MASVATEYSTLDRMLSQAKAPVILAQWLLGLSKLELDAVYCVVVENRAIAVLLSLATNARETPLLNETLFVLAIVPRSFPMSYSPNNVNVQVKYIATTIICIPLVSAQPFGSEMVQSQSKPRPA